MRNGTLRRHLRAEILEARKVLAASVGWDGPGQNEVALTYYIGQAPSGVDQSAFEAAIETALDAWASVANIHFTQTTRQGLSNSLDFTSQSIDGTGGTLAQAYYPDDIHRSGLAGDVQFDAAESWENGNDQAAAAFDMVLVAVHEIGHALGLDHSSLVGSVMYPSIAATQAFTSLSASDISAIQQLYASDSGTLSDPTDTEQETATPDPTAENPLRPMFRFARNSWWGHRWADRTEGVDRLDVGASQWHNIFNPLDVNSDDTITPLDVMHIIQSLRTNVSSELCDTTNDGLVTPLDAMMVIDELRNPTTEVLTVGADFVVFETEDATDPTDVSEGSELNDGTDTTISDPGDTSDNPSDPTDDETSPTDSDPVDPSDEGSGDDDTTEEDDEADENVQCPPHAQPTNPAGRLLFGRLLAPSNVDRLFEALDRDDDGAITESELPEFLWNKLVDAGLDMDDDGSITPSEVSDAIGAKQEEAFTEWDADGDEELSESELPARMWDRLVEADADTDGSGGISLDELLAFQAAAPTHRAQRNEVAIGRPAMLAQRPMPIFRRH